MLNIVKGATISKPIDGALLMFDMGFKVFPIKPNGKTPANNGWQDWAITANRKKVEKYGIANGLHNWAVYCGPSNLAVIDLDAKPGKNGVDSLNAIKANNIVPKTLRVRTPSGGMHLYYKGDVKASISKIGPGIDTRGQGSYVVAPGSRINENSYEIEDMADIVPVPPWIVNILKTKEKPKVIEDEEFIQEGERNSTLTSLAGTMRSRGMSYKPILAALSEVNENQFTTPLPPSEVEIIAASVSKYDPNNAEATAAFASDAPTEFFSKNRDAEDINPHAIPKRAWIMANRYIVGNITTIIAPGGVGKSTYSILEALSVVTGKPLTGEEVQNRGSVWIYNMEDPIDELERRIYAACIQHKIPFDQAKGLKYNSGIEQGFTIATADKSVAENKLLIEATVNYIKKNDIKLFIVDPFVRTHGVNENDNMQIDKVMMLYQRIAVKSGCAVCLIHHTRKPSPKSTVAGDMHQARGASALVNAARIALTLTGMTEEEASNTYGLDPEKAQWHLRIDSAKANLQAPSKGTKWFKRTSIDLFNGDAVGALMLADLENFKEVNAEEVRKAEAIDISRCLYSLFEVNKTKSLRDVANDILGTGQYTHIFGRKKDYRSVYRKLERHIKEGLVYNDKSFTVMEGAGRAGAMIHCVSYKCSKNEQVYDDFLC